MHELGVLRQIVHIVNDVVEKNNIRQVKYITLSVGEFSNFVPNYLMKMFPVAADGYKALRKTKLNIDMVENESLVIKEIGY